MLGILIVTVNLSLMSSKLLMGFKSKTIFYSYKHQVMSSLFTYTY